jgi:hypothetical protein
MIIMTVVRYMIIVLASGAMAAGVLVVAGILVPQNIPEQFRVVLGIVIFLYGLYRLVIVFSRQSER